MNGLGEKKLLNLLQKEPTAPIEQSDYLRETNEYAGLINLGATCYINTYLQVWYNNVIFREYILQAPFDREQLKEENSQGEQEQQEQQERPQNQNELTGGEELNIQLANQLDDNNLKRQFANMITQGNAVNKLYLFQLASDSLNKIDPNLIKLYGIMSVMVQASYYAIPDMPLTNAMKGSAVGSEEIVPNDDGTYTIVARSPFFPYLVHEIVKGLYDYLSMDIVSQSQLDDETLDSELVDIMSGPALYTNLAKLIPQKDIEYLPLVFKLMLGLDVNTIKEILSGGGRTQMHIQKLLQQAKDLQNDYEKEEYED